MDLAFHGLVHTVRTGEPAWDQVFAQPFWDWLDANPAISASFDATMAVDAGNAAVADGYDGAAYGIDGCTHLNDVMRSLAEVSVLVRPHSGRCSAHESWRHTAAAECGSQPVQVTSTIVTVSEPSSIR